jgi:hypothetical protein
MEYNVRDYGATGDGETIAAFGNDIPDPAGFTHALRSPDAHFYS